MTSRSRRTVQHALSNRPHQRPLVAAPATDAEPDHRLPSMLLIKGSGQLNMWRNRSAFRPSTPERIDRLFAEEGCPAAVVVLVDAWTSYGGSQFIDSPGTGRYGEYVCEEVVSFVEHPLPDGRRRCASRPHRQVERRLRRDGGADAAAGRLRRSGYARRRRTARLCYLRDFPEVVIALRDEYDGSFDRFWEDFRTRPAFTKQSDYPLEHVGDGRVLLGERGRLDRSAFRPVDRDAAGRRVAALARVGSGAHRRPPCGCPPRPARDLPRRWKKDEFFLDLGAEAFRRELEKLGITDVFFELFDAGHGAIEYRYPLAIRYLAEQLRDPHRPDRDSQSRVTFTNTRARLSP